MGISRIAVTAGRCCSGRRSSGEVEREPGLSGKEG